MKLIYILSFVLLISCQEKKASQPAGIALSFDDRFIKEWYQLRPLFKKYNAKVTFYVTQPDSLSEEEIIMLRQLQADGHEIGCHGAMHVGSIRYVWEHSTDEYMEKEVFQALRTMKRQGFNPTTFAHPGGSQIWYIDKELLKHFKLLRDVAIKERKIAGFTYKRAVENMDEIYHQYNDSPKVNALLIDVGNNTTIEDIKKGLARAQQENSVMMLFGHRPLRIITHKPEEYGFDIHFLEQILAESAKLKLQYFTMNELHSGL
ncbi:polysaccharide deacetylase family protein [Arcicella aquatica]|uniref:Polysaccharide deacetylase family protein n=1 Tax=Arcicella aquatica TaxID=217141 RepID=A0ABU5QK39_9BACT|nr:polysaccharide deacetylase family protein [Arcicella aquatica]MEA5257430.1 polysaccharide deacetylase family protein [Arcicella aquatica]